ncbi:unnamed protein product [Ranitomeya imitator]|uniref:Uncharacterized protein n=1 Tax=Ranitomeya imitator TaxID=111125 RepID=A0ABN9KT62_9NEOB|nr:unnamed protein product [Ranitomeya imitator]
MGADDQIKMQGPVLQIPSAVPSATRSPHPLTVPTEMARLASTTPLDLPVPPVVTQPQPQAPPQVVLNLQTGGQVVNTANPMPCGGPIALGPISWSTGLFQCCEDIPICILGSICPFFLPCYLSALFGEMCCFGMLPGAMFALRTGVRERYKIPGSLLNDYCAVCGCLVCALCQMAREIKGREWHGSRLPRPDARFTLRR